ncbi:adenylate cyclase 1 [Geobacter sp. OR-1]|uniref:CHASE2 domain-containing protein n=1 Tax=Geobacter sp. OR-1 TaxID=1266765 RepID=UPI00054201CC|nr:adenylate/guanylate cyclase domain-containing protein [Geobacter sp. OR-1]GAM09475.1 adenylate cyclase 1 [Geobacter sp. OR-1]
MDLFRRKFLLYLILAVASALATFLLYRSAIPFLTETDLILKDTRLRLRGAQPPDPRVAIVAVDNRSVKDLGRWPWPRARISELVTAIISAGARVVALDMVFSEPQTPQDDQLLVRSMSASDRVIAGYFFRVEQTEPAPRSLELLSLSRIKMVRLEPGADAGTIPDFPFVELNTGLIAREGQALGFFNQLPDRDGVVRSTPLLCRFKGEMFPSLALMSVSAYLNAPVAATIAPFGLRSLSIGGITLPAAEDGRLSLCFYGPGGTVPIYSASDLVLNKLPRGALHDRLVFLGVTETGISDLRITPFDPSFPGVEILATAASNILEQRFLIHDSRTYGIEMAAIFLLPFLQFLAIALSRRALFALAAFVLAEGLFLGGNFLMFSLFRFDISLFFPTLALGMTYVCSESYRSLILDRQARYLKKAFSSYVSADLVRELVKRPEMLKLGGVSREVTVIISDMRKFSTISEKLGPEGVVSLLSRYLSAMTEIVMEEHGTLIQYVGDEIVALFNAPLDTPDHASRACRCAVRMTERLQTLNAEFLASGLPEIDIGIGINSGVVIVGNIGAERRFQYTAVGDAVNLASRLEGLNKYFGTRILASAATVKASGSSHFFREIDRVRVKGRKGVTTVYELLEQPLVYADEFGSAMTMYRNRMFSEAREAFSELAERSGDPVAFVYTARCDDYLASPPSGDWDGVYVPPGK